MFVFILILLIVQSIRGYRVIYSGDNVHYVGEKIRMNVENGHIFHIYDLYTNQQLVTHETGCDQSHINIRKDYFVYYVCNHQVMRLDVNKNQVEIVHGHDNFDFDRFHIDQTGERMTFASDTQTVVVTKNNNYHRYELYCPVLGDQSIVCKNDARNYTVIGNNNDKHIITTLRLHDQHEIKSISDDGLFMYIQSADTHILKRLIDHKYWVTAHTFQILDKTQKECRETQCVSQLEESCKEHRDEFPMRESTRCCREFLGFCYAKIETCCKYFETSFYLGKQFVHKVSPTKIHIYYLVNDNLQLVDEYVGDDTISDIRVGESNKIILNQNKIISIPSNKKGTYCEPSKSEMVMNHAGEYITYHDSYHHCVSDCNRDICKYVYAKPNERSLDSNKKFICGFFETCHQLVSSPIQFVLEM